MAESRAMIWKWHYPQLTKYFEQATGQKLQAGLTVLVKVQVSFSELYGMSLYIEDIDAAFTLGAQAMERKKAIERLTKDGYMDMQKELAIPDIPYKLAVITSKTAAGYQDFRNHLLNNPEGYAFQLDLYEAMMQGEQAPESIAEALSEAAQKEYDAILILRGGGSETDLQCFDDFDLAIEIATCPVPVVTAIGHDKDVHIADMVAHQSVKTPTALADLFLDALRAQDQMLDRLQDRIGMGMNRWYMSQAKQLEAASGRIRLGLARAYSSSAQRCDAAAAKIRIGLNRKLADVQSAVQKASGRIAKGLSVKYMSVERQVDGMIHRIKFAASAKHSAAFSELALKEALINGSDPRKILGLGYVLVTGKDNKILKTVDRVSIGDRIGVRFNDGSLMAKVDEIYSERFDKSNTA